MGCRRHRPPIPLPVTRYCGIYETSTANARPTTPSRKESVGPYEGGRREAATACG
ncbi:hypothetical protein C8Q79DRAFT_954563 [Trametes meyenii]|nr:hypothetical protein C8Q79DRAFT_954563 [Trametes meyenii]